MKSGKSQSLDPQPAPSATHKKLPYQRTTDISLGAFGQLTPSRIRVDSSQSPQEQYSNQIVDWTTPSTGVLTSLHQQFKPWLGYNANLGYTRSMYNYAASYVSISTHPPPYNGTYASFVDNWVGTNMYEVSLMAVVQGPHEKRFSTFAEAGGGLLTFLPTKRPSTTAVQIRPAAPFGVGLNYKLSDRWGLRGEYRAHFYKTPDFRDPGNNPDNGLL